MRDFFLRSHRVIDRIMTEQGASFARAKLLMYIAAHGPTRSIDLATAFDQAPRTVTEAVDGMERDRLVRRDPDREDRRAKRISLTEAGMAAAEKAERARSDYIATVFSALTAAECDEMTRLFGKLNHRLVEMGG